MFCISFFNPSQIQGITWAFLPPIQQPPIHVEFFNNACLMNNQASGSPTPSLRDTLSPNARSSESMTNLENSCSLKMKLDKNKKIKQNIQEEEFKPNVPQVKKCRKTPQNANRNVVPNIMHQVISFLHKKNKSEKLVEKLIKDEGLEDICSVKRFYYYQLLVKEKLNHYVNSSSLTVLKDLQQPSCQVYSELEQRHYNKISRLLVQYFLSREFDTIILTSKRMSSDKKLDHLKTKRRILAHLKEMFSE